MYTYVRNTEYRFTLKPWFHHLRDMTWAKPNLPIVPLYLTLYTLTYVPLFEENIFCNIASFEMGFGMC